MRFVFFAHSLRSDWSHGGAHFLRGITAELQRTGHAVEAWEPEGGWSSMHLERDHGSQALHGFRSRYPDLVLRTYPRSGIDLARELEGADVVIVHDWNDPELVARIGQVRRHDPRLRLLFHDTHHRAVTRPHEIGRYDLAHYDGVLAFGRVIRDRYLERGWVRAAWTWHEAVDSRVFWPRDEGRREGHLVWIGNWGDAEHSHELSEFLLEPVRDLRLTAMAYGARYPDRARSALASAGMRFGGWLPNVEVPRVYARFSVTLHVPRAPFALPGVPTIRVFEALACGIPLVCAPWEDSERLFTPGRDFLVAHDGAEMRRRLLEVICDPDRARRLAAHGLATIQARHTCAHRVRELFGILAQLGLDPDAAERRTGVPRGWTRADTPEPAVATPAVALPAGSAFKGV